MRFGFSTGPNRFRPTDVTRAKIMKNIAAAFPPYAGIEDQFVRDTILPEFSTFLMFDGLNAAWDYIESTDIRNDTVETVQLDVPAPDGSVHFRPTHLLALYKEGEDTVSLFCPTHYLALAAHCSNLPQFTPSFPMPVQAGMSSVYTVPVQPLIIPTVSSPHTFDALQMYLYTNDTNAFGQDFPDTCGPGYISDIYRIACSLGVVHNELYDTLELAYARASD